MKHLQSYELFEAFTSQGVKIPEGDTWNPNEHPYYINMLPWMQKWLDQVRTIEAGDPGIEASKIITPYGLELEIDMDPDDGSAEDIGECEWGVDSWGEDDWGIYYILPGTVSGVNNLDDLSDGIWTWNDEVRATIGYRRFDPIKFLEKAFPVQPVLAAQLYDVLTPDKKREADLMIQRMGIKRGMIKGGKLLGKLE